MDMIDRLVGHDLWTTGEVLRRCGELTDAQLDQDFDIDHRTVRATLIHMIANMETWASLMEPPPASVTQRLWKDSIESQTERYRAAGEKFRTVAKRIAHDGRLEERFLDFLDEPPREKPNGAGIAHVITHDMHHRAQVLYMLDKLGLTDLPEGDLLGWEMSYRFR